MAPDDPAVRVVTDFARDEPRTISPAQRIEDALCEMVCAAVRALLVVRNDMVIGLITSHDIEGQQRSEFMRDCLARREMQVQHVMTPWDRLVTLEWRSVCAARAGQIEAHFRNTRATHIVLVEQVGYLGPCVRGLISRARVTREMGCAL